MQDTSRSCVVIFLRVVETASSCDSLHLLGSQRCVHTSLFARLLSLSLDDLLAQSLSLAEYLPINLGPVASVASGDRL